MKELITVRSNAVYFEKTETKTLTLGARLEIVLIHTDGKKYEVEDEELTATNNIVEHRYFVDSSMLASLITELQFHQKKLEALNTNAETITHIIGSLNKVEK